MGEFDQEKKRESETFIEDYDKKSEEEENEISQVVDEVYEVVTGGPQKTSSDDFEFGTEEATMKNEDNNEIEIPQGLLVSSDIISDDKSYEEEDMKKLEEILNEEEYDISLSVGL